MQTGKSIKMLMFNSFYFLYRKIATAILILVHVFAVQTNRAQVILFFKIYLIQQVVQFYTQARSFVFETGGGGASKKSCDKQKKANSENHENPNPWGGGGGGGGQYTYTFNFSCSFSYFHFNFSLGLKRGGLLDK